LKESHRCFRGAYCLHHQGDGRKCNNEVVHNFYPSSNIIRTIKTWKILAEDVKRLREIINALKNDLEARREKNIRKILT
jgi:hypothetical protein